MLEVNSILNTQEVWTHQLTCKEAFTSAKEECSQKACLSEETEGLNWQQLNKSDLNRQVFSEARHRQE